MARPVLLDVNVLIALFDSAHVHHGAAHAWFSVHQERGWRTCPMTENGYLRILSHPSYPNGPLSVVDLAERLEELKRSSARHAFWSDDFSLCEWVERSKRHFSSAKLTDVYLLQLAAGQKGTLATFDSRLEPSTIGESNPEVVEHIPL